MDWQGGGSPKDYLRMVGVGGTCEDTSILKESENPTGFELKKKCLYFGLVLISTVVCFKEVIALTWICNYIPALYSRNALFQSAANVKLNPISESSLKVPATNESKYLSQPCIP